MCIGRFSPPHVRVDRAVKCRGGGAGLRRDRGGGGDRPARARDDRRPPRGGDDHGAHGLRPAAPHHGRPRGGHPPVPDARRRRRRVLLPVPEPPVAGPAGVPCTVSGKSIASRQAGVVVEMLSTFRTASWCQQKPINSIFSTSSVHFSPNDIFVITSLRFYVPLHSSTMRFLMKSNFKRYPHSAASTMVFKMFSQRQSG